MDRLDSIIVQKRKLSLDVVQSSRQPLRYFWIRQTQAAGNPKNLGKPNLVEDEENYRVKIALPDADPQKLEVEVSEWRLAVRAPMMQGLAESTLDFSHRIDIERVTARFDAGILEVLAPKARGRKIEVR